MLRLNLSLHRMLLFESCVSLFYWSKTKTTEARISTDSLWLHQNCYFSFKAFCFCPPGWIPPWLAALCPSPAAGHRAGWGWAKPHLGPQRMLPSPMATGKQWALLFCCSGHARMVLDQWQPPSRCPHWANPPLEAEPAAVPVPSLHHVPSRGMDSQFPGVSGRWIYFKPSQGIRALPGLCAQGLLVISGCSTTKLASV